MWAVRLEEHGRPAVAQVAEPVPAPGEVVLKVLAAGVCHSDLNVCDLPAEQSPYRPPFTLGHEVAGEVVELGPGTTGIGLGTPAVVYAPWGCAICARCERGERNYCDNLDGGPAGVGLGIDGGMAQYLRVAADRLVPAQGIDPAVAATLTDAGLTSWHAVRRVAHAVARPGQALVIGVGGLGHLALQILRATTSAWVAALDNRHAAVELAHRLGAHAAYRSAEEVVGDGERFDAVLDFVGTDDTLGLAVRVLRRDGHLAYVGSGGGRLTVAKPRMLPPGLQISLPYWGSRDELAEVLEAARRGLLGTTLTRYPLEKAMQAFADLRAGAVVGRAVLCP